MNFGTGCDQERLGRICRRREHVSPVSKLIRWRQFLAIEDREVLAAQDQGHRAVEGLQGGAPGSGGLGGVGRPDDVRPGMARRAATCSTGWWVGPSSAHGDAVMREDVDDRKLHQRRQPDRGPHVIGKYQESAAIGPHASMQGQAERIAPMACSRTPKRR